ncbi:MAG: rhomboid family intramembrane serine protease [Labilithrix sp.]|nr:rhomboid family intramembrane serine protease [Labilithrix sp.]MCW5812310.1 rhomboid family intramembrane serine protease [Labilithrix sp.]
MVSASPPASAPTSASAPDQAEQKGIDGAPITGALLAANAGVFAAQVSLAGHLRFGLGGADVRDQTLWNAILRWLGGNDSTFTIADTRVETLVTSCFLHGSILHLGFNMLVLWQVGPFLERAIGPARFLPLYLGAGVMGSAFSAIAGRLFGASLSIGASGAVCGLIGSMLVLGARTQGWKGPLARQMAGWLAFLFVLGLAKNLQGGMVQVDNAAHIGGAVGGVLVAATWQRGVTYTKKAERAIVGACVALVLLCGITVYVRDRTDPYLFMSLDERLDAAWRAAKTGKCDEADIAMKRAQRLDPGSALLRDRARDVDRLCLAGQRP